MQKVLSVADLRAEREKLRDEGKLIVFTNGVFDVLHVGHVRYLSGARGLGDLLIVAVNSDRAIVARAQHALSVLRSNVTARKKAKERQLDCVIGTSVGSSDDTLFTKGGFSTRW